MKRTNLFILLIITCLSACKQGEEVVPIVATDACALHIPFYEQQDVNTESLSVACDCMDSLFDLGAALMPFIKVRNLNFNCDETLFDEIPIMPSVKYLVSDVTTSNVQAFPNLEVFKNKTYLTTPLAYQLVYLPNLREISLFNAMDVPSFIAQKELDVFKMTFQNTASHTVQLPINLSTLTNLTELNIRDVDIAIFSNFEHLVNLKTLKLSNVLWVRIPEVDNQWLKLTTLELSAVELRRDIPDIFENMDSLESIYINETKVSTNTQRNIFEAPNLKELTFSFCELGAIPDEIGNLTTLEQLIITTQQNTINTPITLPLTIKNLTNLKSIFMSTNVTQFPVELFELTNTLESLSIKDNIGSVPSEIGDFAALKVLKLTNCGLNALPLEIQNLENTLEQLYLTGNNFDEPTKQQIENWLPNTTVYF